MTSASTAGAASCALESRQGDILQAPGSLIDLSASHNRAGSLTAIALDPLAGRVDLLGAIQGQASGRYDAGGTWCPTPPEASISARSVWTSRR